MPDLATIALVVIARDEERCIRRLLRSACDVVDEMVVVDTGSTDATREIARSEGAQVHSFAWVDDFATAKNAALAHASASARLVLDADEWIVDGGEGLRRWVRSGPPRYGTVACTSTFADGTQSATDHLVRILPDGAYFTGRVHEQPAGDYPMDTSPVCIAHDGYEPRQMARKRGRNERLLRSELLERPTDGYLWYQLGCALDSDSRYTQACAAFGRALPLVGQDSPQRHPLVTRYLYSLGQAKRFDDALAFYRAEAGPWGDSPDLHFVMADVLLDLALARPARAESLVPLIRRLLRRCLEIGERPDLPGAVTGRGSDSARRNLDLCGGMASPPAGGTRG